MPPFFFSGNLPGKKTENSMHASIIGCGEHETRIASQGTFTFCRNGASIPFHKLNMLSQKDFLMGKSKQSAMETNWSELIILLTLRCLQTFIWGNFGEPDKTKYLSTKAKHTILKPSLIS